MSMYNYLGTPNNNLICCICRAPFLDPLTSKLCSHTFCSSCILQALSHASQCPIDRTAMTERDLERAPGIVRAMVDELEVECVYAPPRREVHGDQGTSKDNIAANVPTADLDIPTGCKWTGERETLGAHLEVCEYAEGNNGDINHRDGSGGMRPSTNAAVINEDESQPHLLSGPGTSALLSSPDTTGTSSHLLQSTLQVTSGSCPHAAFGCPYIAPTDAVLSPELGGDDSSAIMQADIETHLASCPYESLKGFFGVFSSTVSSQRQAIDESKRREDTLHATILELKENEKRAKLVLEQNILLKRRLESLEGVATNLKKELANIRVSLGPWATGMHSSRSTTNLGTATTFDTGIDLSSMNRYPATGSTSMGGVAHSAALTSPPSATSFPIISSTSDRSPERQSPVSYPMQHVPAGWGNGSSEIPLLNSASPFANISPRIDDTGSGNPGPSNDAFAPYFPNAGEEYTGTSFHPQHRRATSSVFLPHMIPPLDTTSSLEATLQRLHASVVTIATSVEGLTLQMEGVARRGELGLANEAVRVGEEIGSLRAQIYGLRMLVHGLMVERGMGTRWPVNGPTGGGPGMNMGDADDEQRNHTGPHFPQTIPMGMPPPPPFFLRNAGLGMGMGPMGGPSITKL